MKADCNDTRPRLGSKVIHFTGTVDDDGLQRCAVCGQILTLPGETPTWPAAIYLIEHRAPKGSTWAPVKQSKGAARFGELLLAILNNDVTHIAFMFSIICAVGVVVWQARGEHPAFFWLCVAGTMAFVGVAGIAMWKAYWIVRDEMRQARETERKGRS